ncbi:MAG: glycosyltransferase N-terminal domain-containing protein [Gemmatimonadaceae bacterium]
MERWRKLVHERRDRSKSLIWFHAPSVGEGLQARPVIEMLRERHPEIQIGYSFFSPSAKKFASTLNVDFADYLPFDSRSDARELFDIIKPTVLAFVKLDVWPNFVAIAAEKRVPVVLLSATVSARSQRQSAFARLLLHDAYQNLTAVGAIDSSDANRLKRIGVRDSAISVTGDTRFDQVAKRASLLDRQTPLLQSLRKDDEMLIVAGSTWPADERVLLPAFVALRKRLPNVRLIIAPHEPTAEHVNPISDWATQSGFTHNVLSNIATRPRSAEAVADVTIVDSVGVLGDLYALADVAFVGGGFHSAGLHSVLEPAAYGVPVVFGPQHEMSRDAQLLLEFNAAASVANAEALANVLLVWLITPFDKLKAGQAATNVVTAGTGASERSLQLLLKTLEIASRASEAPQ